MVTQAYLLWLSVEIQYGAEMRAHETKRPISVGGYEVASITIYYFDNKYI